MARQLSALDAQFLNFETAANPAHIAGLTVLDPTTAPDGVVTKESLIALLKRRAHLAPPLRRRLVEVPFGLDHPYWAEDREVDWDYHVRELALPAPGNDHQLGEQVARLHGRRLDRRRPLWELYLIHGLEGGRVAVYTKVHHSAIDGIEGAEVLAALMDLTPEPREVEQDQTPPATAPDLPEMLGRGFTRLLDNPSAVLRFVANAVPRLDEIPVVAQIPGAGLIARVIRGVGWSADSPVLPDLPRVSVPRTPFSGPVTPHRRFAFGRLPLADVKKVKNAYGVSVNDVVMAVCAGAVRRWLDKRDELPAEPLVVGIPFSTRGDAADDSVANQVLLATTTLPTDQADAQTRLFSVSKAMNAVKERFSVAPARWLLEFSQAMPAALSGMADRAAFRLASRTVPAMNLMISNVPGPQLPLYICGARVLAQYPVSVITDVSGGLNITVFSYDGSLDVGIVVDREMVPDVWDFIEYLQDALAELMP
ncbi:WS/DGAT/MGAT family O-acyltransferase [Acrocarpospora catenulata]|uniref:WS/DGAT/MGAT family O-acyltransferase n=1 Tax=Acrocarpospora catenulata TaxID=2836182 RepID=UPI001BDA7D5F|nr:wax ester/triacylglycerol synthase family O-acyltransferase [Acrocarpospora catenulata]